MEPAFYGAVLRFVQAALLAAPTILVSLFVVGVLRRLFGRDLTHRIFGESGWKSLAQSWIIGMLLPGCSLGVIPICRELRRVGLTGGAVLAFGLSQPLFDPLSLLYGLTLSKPHVVIAFSLCSLVLVMAVGGIWDRLCPKTTAPEPAPAPVRAGWPRMLSVLLVMLREAGGPSLVYIVIGLMGTAVLAAVLPHSALASAMNGGDPWAPWTMLWVSIPAYATPTLAMGQLGSMFQHANSAGAALLLLTFGAGLNLGLVAWTFQVYGRRSALLWFLLMIATGLTLAYAIDRPLHPRDVDPANHTHAFDIYCSPFHAGAPDVPALTLQALRERLTPFEVAPLIAFLLLAAAGVLLNRYDPNLGIEKWLESREADHRPSRFDFVIPAPIVGGFVLAGIIALSIVGCFAYYPPRSEVLAELQSVRAEAVYAAKEGDIRKTDHYIGLWDQWTRRLEVGVFLRTGSLSRYQQMKARILREKLERLRHEVEDGDAQAAAKLVKEVNVAYERMKGAF